MNLIAAVDKNWAIGCKNKLLVSIPADMKFFRETTTGKVVVMGRKTLESFPNGQPLKKRVNIVLTRDKNFKAGDAIIVHSMEELREELKKYPSEDIYVIGGETIYKQLLDDCDVAISQRSTMHLRQMPISRISMRCRSGKSRRTVRNRRILIWNIIFTNTRKINNINKVVKIYHTKKMKIDL